MDGIGARFLERVYDATGGSTDRMVPGAPIGAALGIDEAAASILAKGIADEGYLRWYMGDFVTLTAAGIDRVRAVRGPGEGKVLGGRGTD